MAKPKRDKRFEVRLSDEEVALLKKMSEGISEADLFRLLLREEAKRRGLLPPSP